VQTAEKLLEARADAPGIKVIDLSEVPSTIVPLVCGVLARLIFEIQFWMKPESRTPVCLVCDEAHLYLPAAEDTGPFHAVALRAFESIAKEGRKYGVALVVVSQRPTDVSRTILSQCHNFMIMRVTNDYDRAMIERLIPETLAGVTTILPVLDIGEAIVIGDALLLPTRIKLDPPMAAPASDTQPYWSLWSDRASSAEAIAAGAEAARNQFRE
jgi:DNA helicase HerA-like ATPase